MTFLKRFRMNKNEVSIQEFINSKKTMARRTWKFYEVGLARYLEFAGSQYPPTPQLITDFILHCQSRGLKTRTTFAYFRAVKTWIRWMIANGHIQHNPLRIISPPREPRTRIPKAPPEEDTKKLFRYMELEIELAIKQDALKEKWETVRDFAIFSVLLGTGARIGEVEHLLISDLDFSMNRVHLRVTKDREERYAKFSKRVGQDLALWLRVREMLPLPKSLKHVFVSIHKKLYFGPATQSGMRIWLKTWCRSAKVKEIRPHDFRHAFAIRSLENGATLTDIRDQLGHEKISTTDIYLRATAKSRDERIERAAPR